MPPRHYMASTPAGTCSPMPRKPGKTDMRQYVLICASKTVRFSGLSSATELACEQESIGGIMRASNPPVIRGETPWLASIYRGLVPTKNVSNRQRSYGMAFLFIAPLIQDIGEN